MLERNYQGAIYWLREALRRDPADADAHYVLAAALQASGSDVEAAREKELARQLSSRYEELERRAAADKLPVPEASSGSAPNPDTPRRPARPSRRSSTPRSAISASWRRSISTAAGGCTSAKQDREAMAELRRAVYLSPYEAQAHLLIGRIHLRAGRPQEAVNALKISIWSEDTAAARIALAEAYLKLQNPPAARAELERALALDPASADAKRMLAEIK